VEVVLISDEELAQAFEASAPYAQQLAQWMDGSETVSPEIKVAALFLYAHRNGLMQAQAGIVIDIGRGKDARRQLRVQTRTCAMSAHEKKLYREWRYGNLWKDKPSEPNGAGDTPLPTD
jgi:hypothetical protein